MFRRLALLALVCGIAALAFAALFPITNRMVRLMAMLGLSAALGGFLFLCWRQRVLRGIFLILLGTGILFLLLPGNRDFHKPDLIIDYIGHLKRFNYVKYVWGGENYRGIDCSGLVRRGMIDALIASGIRTGNPYLVREAIRLWWTDTTAKGLADGNDTVPVQSLAGPLPSVALLQPGDLAVSADGIHVLAYLGEDQWIDADPTAGSVRILSTGENPWLADPVRVVRWAWLAGSNGLN